MNSVEHRGLGLLFCSHKNVHNQDSASTCVSIIEKISLISNISNLFSTYTVLNSSLRVYMNQRFVWF